MILKTELSFLKGDKSATDELELLFIKFEENLSPSEYLIYVETLDKLLNFVSSDDLINILLKKQEMILNQIPLGYYFNIEVDKWKLRTAVNLYALILKNSEVRGGGKKKNISLRQ